MESSSQVEKNLKVIATNIVHKLLQEQKVFMQKRFKERQITMFVLLKKKNLISNEEKKGTK